MAMESLILFLSGFFSALTPEGIFFLVITLSLAGFGIHERMISLLYVSLGLLVLVFILNLNVISIFPVGAVQGSLITGGNFLDKSVHNFGLIIVPLIVNVIGLFLLKK